MRVAGGDLAVYQKNRHNNRSFVMVSKLTETAGN